MKMTTKEDGQDTYKHYIHFMKEGLSIDNYDILLLCHEDDKDIARTFESEIVKHCKIPIGTHQIEPQIQIEDEFFGDGNPMKRLDQAFHKAFLIFPLFTKNFFSDQDTVHRAYTCLKTGLDVRMQWCLFPVHLITKAELRMCKCPMELFCLTSIKYMYHTGDNEDTWKTIRRILSSNFHRRLDMDIKLERKRRQYYEKNKAELHDVKKQSGIVCSAENSQTLSPAMDSDFVRNERGMVVVDGESSPSSLRNGANYQDDLPLDHLLSSLKLPVTSLASEPNALLDDAKSNDTTVNERYQSKTTSSDSLNIPSDHARAAVDKDNIDNSKKQTTEKLVYDPEQQSKKTTAGDNLNSTTSAGTEQKGLSDLFPYESYHTN